MPKNFKTHGFIFFWRIFYYKLLIIRKKFEIFQYLSNKWIDTTKSQNLSWFLTFIFIFCLKSQNQNNISQFFLTCNAHGGKNVKFSCFQLKTVEKITIAKRKSESYIPRNSVRVLARCLSVITQFLVDLKLKWANAKFHEKQFFLKF